VFKKVRERLTVSKQAVHEFDTVRYNLINLKEVELKEQHQVKLSNIFLALKIDDDDDDDDDDNVDSSRA
jgi:signal transduction histidine kinase